MKKALLLLFITPLHAMETMDMDEFTTDEFLALEKESQEKSSEDNLDPEQLCKDLLKTNKDLGEYAQACQFSIGGIDTLIAQTYAAIQDKKAEDAARSYAYFEQRTGLDFTFLNSKQKGEYQKLSDFLRTHVDDMQPAEIKKMRILQRTNRFKNQTEPWLHAIVENDTCTDLKWRTILASDDTTSLYPFPKDLREKRLAITSTFGTIQEMQKKK
jgi:hypothetical protein